MSKQFSRIAVLAAIVGSSTFASAARPSTAQLRSYVRSALQQNAKTKAFKPWQDKHIAMELHVARRAGLSYFQANNIRKVVGPADARVVVGAMVTGTVRLTDGKGKRVSIEGVSVPRVAAPVAAAR